MSNGTPNPPNNGDVLNLAQIIKAVMSSAAEAELGALYFNEFVGQTHALNRNDVKPPATVTVSTKRISIFIYEWHPRLQ